MKEIIVTAVLSAMLTVSGSYFVMKSQLTAEQDYWLKRQNYEQSQQVLNKKIELLESFNDKFLKLDLLTSQMKLESSSFQAELHICHEAIILKSENYECKAKVEKFLSVSYAYRQQMYDLSVILQMLPIYYPTKVTSLIEPLNKVIEDNYHSVDKSLEKFDSTKLSRPMADYFKRDMRSTKEFQEYRGLLIEAMLTNIQQKQ
ncbi:hypothetical protein OAE_09860 [Vibrio cyclitrophicus 1F289]|uniref:hypothetical protein n=1 Tax=Vibrio cyclitrophicus TaxID=47951 RepID=UPI0002F4C49A|nr:hypothetical protein [Vibrio cyclitrophicus]OEF38095.1 hypothetical protein OAE_09860 [Vibrio cyclitrophicus 1F289]PMF19185.1 hypothetical protein BCV20_01650 [Vibrio cyclitrophicus]